MPQENKSPLWYFEKSQNGTYVALHGSEDDKDLFVGTLVDFGITVLRSGRSYRPASNGVLYDWYITIEDASEQNVKQAIENIENIEVISKDLAPRTILLKLKKIGIEVVASGQGIEFEGAPYGFKNPMVKNLMDAAKARSDEIIEVLEFQGLKNAPNKGLRWSDQDHDRAQSLLDVGYSVEKVAYLMGRTPSAIEMRFSLGTESEDETAETSEDETKSSNDPDRTAGERNGETESITSKIDEVESSIEVFQKDVFNKLDAINSVIEKLTASPDQANDFELENILEEKTQLVDKLQKELEDEKTINKESAAFINTFSDEEKENTRKSQEKIEELEQKIRAYSTTSPLHNQQTTSACRGHMDSITIALKILTPNINYLGDSVDRLFGQPRERFTKPENAMKIIKKLSDGDPIPFVRITQFGDTDWKEYGIRGKPEGRTIQSGQPKLQSARLYFRKNGNSHDVIVDFKSNQPSNYKQMKRLS